MPAAMETPCPSAMPTSKKRSGKVLAKPERPVPSAMAAVIAQTRASSRAKSARALPKTEEKLSSPAFFKRPVSGSKGPTPWYMSGFRSAKAQPLPLTVFTWTTTGQSNSRAQRRASHSRGRSWPSTGPR